MKPIAILNDNFKNHMTVEYLVGTTCNYKCHYCFPGCNDGTYRFTEDLDLLKKNLGYMIGIYQKEFNKSDIRLHIAGGEPSLWPKLGDFAEYFNKEFGCRLTVATNGSRTLRFWKDYAQYFEDICVSVHNEACDVEHIKQLMDWVYENTDCLINAMVLMDPFNWNKCVSIAEELKNHPTPWLLKVRPIILNGVMAFYTKEQNEYIKEKVKKMPPKEWIEKMQRLDRIPKSESAGMMLKMDNDEIIKADTHYIMENDWYHFQGWKCNLGVDRFIIGRDGTIEGSCGAKNLFNLETPLSIYDPDLTNKFNSSMVKELTCVRPHCDCPSEIKLPKRIDV